MVEQQGGLPVRGILEFEFNTESFTSLAERTIKFLDLKVLIHIKPGTKGSVPVRFIESVMPDQPSSQALLPMDKPILQGLIREKEKGFIGAESVIFQKLSQNIWFLYGITQDHAKRPICVLAIPNFASSYCFTEKPLIVPNFIISPTPAGFHNHICSVCGYHWQHAESCFDDINEHTCIACGKVTWQAFKIETGKANSSTS